MFDLSFGKLLLIGALALFLLGPEKLPVHAVKLAQWVRLVRGMVDGAKEGMREELGPDFDDTDWKALDPRRYDPRRIVREALLEEPKAAERPRSPRPAAAYEVVEEPAQR